MRVAVTLEQCWHRVPGGTTVATNELARALAHCRDLELVGVAARHRDRPDPEWEPPIPVRHLRLPRRVLYETWHRWRWPPVEWATGGVDLIHATAVAIPPATAPLVATIHDLAFLEDTSRVTRHGLRFLMKGLELALAHARLVTCPSQSTLDECVKAGFDRARLRVVPWGIRTEPATSPDVHRVRQRYGLEQRYLLYCGTIEPRKNLRRLVEAFRRVDRRSLELVLVGPEGWNEDARTLLAGVEGRARLLGFVPRADLAPLYAGAEALCFPSLREGFGLPVAEAMAQGTPVVTSAGTATEEVANGAAVLVNPYDVSAIVRGIDQVLDDDVLRERLAAAGPARAGTLTWERAAERMLAVYDEAASAKKGEER